MIPIYSINNIRGFFFFLGGGFVLFCFSVGWQDDIPIRKFLEIVGYEKHVSYNIFRNFFMYLTIHNSMNNFRLFMESQNITFVLTTFEDQHGKKSKHYSEILW